VPTYWQYQLQTATVNALSYPVNNIDNGSVNSATTLSGLYNLTCHFYLNNPADLGNIIISFYDPSSNLVYRKALADFSPVVDGHNFYLTVNNISFYTALSCEVTTTRNTSVSDVNLFQFFNLQLTQLQQNLLLTPKQQMNGGGLRIRQIINNDGSGEQAYKQYQYNNDIGTSSGQIMNYPIYMSFASESPTVEFTADNFSSRSIIGLSTNAGGDYIGYSQVREIVGDSTRNAGSTVSYYSNLPDVTPYDYGINLPTEQRSENGLLLQQMAFDANNNKISRLANTYSTFDQNNWKSTTGAYFTRYGVGDWKDGSYSELYLYKEYQLDYKLLNSTQTLFAQMDTTKFTQANTAYQYQNNTNPRRVLKANSLGGQDITEYRYADDFVPGAAPPFVLQMQNANIFSKPIEVVSLKVLQNTAAVKGSVNIYGTADQLGLLLNQYELYTAAPLAWDNTKFTDALSNASSLNFEPHYTLKNTFGYSNLHKQVTDYASNGSTISYQWGYNNAYPVAECKNATSGEIYYEGFEDNTAGGISGTAHTGTHFTTNPNISWTLPNGRAYIISYWYFSGSAWQYSGPVPYTSNTYTMTGGSAYDDVRIHPIDAQMTTYAYLMGTGMTSATDAKGQTTYYEYDSLQRLLNIKDTNGNIVKHFDYHFQNQ
jgi:YD repeat-containing protein